MVLTCCDKWRVWTSKWLVLQVFCECEFWEKKKRRTLQAWTPPFITLMQNLKTHPIALQRNFWFPHQRLWSPAVPKDFAVCWSPSLVNRCPVDDALWCFTVPACSLMSSPSTFTVSICVCCLTIHIISNLVPSFPIRIRECQSVYNGDVLCKVLLAL